MLNGLKKVTSAVVALLIAFTLTGAFSRFDEIQVNADTTTTTTATAANMYTLSGKASMQSYGNKKGSFSNGILTLGKKGKKFDPRIGCDGKCGNCNLGCENAITDIVKPEEEVKEAKS